MKSLTTAKVSTIKDGAIHLKGLEQVLGIGAENKVLLIGTASKFIRVIPLKGPRVIQIHASFSSSDFSDAARSVLQKLKALGMSMVHSTGFCPIDDACFWEGFFEDVYGDRIDEFVNWLREQNAVLEVTINTLT
ncbi:MAG: hypothetical protein K9W43_02305 [Candidatus Thorarchaeota archaeon]|nr:hypothetical protein [Candidatus Thorarchaeota archaeon]